MKKFIILLIVVVLIFLVYRGWSSGVNDTVKVEPVTVTLATQNKSGESGQAILTEVDGQVKVVVNLTGTPAGVSQPAHIHHGTCAALGEPVYALSPVTDGASETTLTAAFQAIKSGLPLAINVHKSAAESSVYVVCGDILLK